MREDGASMSNKIVCTDAVVTTKAFEECRVKEGRRRKRSREGSSESKSPTSGLLDFQELSWLVDLWPLENTSKPHPTLYSGRLR